MSVIDTETITGFEVNGVWNMPFCTLEARIGDKDTGRFQLIATLDLEEISDLITKLQAMYVRVQRMTERMEAEW